MLKAFLAHSGGEVVIPEAEVMKPGDSEDVVHFLDAAGRVLVSFRREDLVMITDDDSLSSKLASRRDGDQVK